MVSPKRAAARWYAAASRLTALLPLAYSHSMVPGGFEVMS